MGFSLFAKAQSCAVLTSADPLPVEDPLTWTAEPTAVGYVLTIGTTPGGNDLGSNIQVINPTYFPTTGWPENETIYVTIGLREDPGDPDPTTICDEQSFDTAIITTIPDCNIITTPPDGDIDTSLTPLISWTYAPRATEYVLDLGTTSGASDVIANEVISGDVLSFLVPFDLNEGTQYFVRITPRNGVGANTSCSNENSFTTLVLDTSPPECTVLITPENGQIEVALTPLLEWAPVANADGYRVTIGTTPGGNDVLDNADLGNVTSTLVLDFDEGIMYYVLITPYNSFGPAEDCPITSFTTTLGCGPYLDAITGEIVDLNPVINLEELYQICLNDPPLQLIHVGIGEIFSWTQITDTGEIELSTENNITISESGIYRFDVATEVPIEDGIIICESTHTFEVISSEAPTLQSLNPQLQGLLINLSVDVTGSGDYEYSINSIDGPYQDSPIFTGLPIGPIEVFVRDKNGCGIVSDRIDPDFDLGFPKYFTPNGDGINDFWQVRGRVVNGETITRIEVFDRFGKRIIAFTPFDIGWDGTFNGHRLLDSGFWYKASTLSNRVLVGHFALRR